MNSTFSLNVAPRTNVWEGSIPVLSSPYSVSILFAVGKVWKILDVTSPIPYTTFTCWVTGAKISAVKRVSSPFRSQRLLPCVFRMLEMYLAF